MSCRHWTTVQNRRKNDKRAFFCALFSCYNERAKKQGDEKVKKNKAKRLYHKLFWTYTALACLIVGILGVYFMTVMVKNTVSTRQEECRHLGEEVAEYIEEQETQADYLFTQLYRGTHELSDLLAFLTMEPDAYRAYVLDYFSESNGRSYNGIEKFVSNAFEAYPELEQVEFLSYSTKKQFLFLSQEVVYPYRDGEARLREIQEGTWKKKEGELTYIKEIINPSTMKQEGCMIFTFSVKQHLQKISESRSWADLLVMEEDGETVYSSFEQKEDKWRQEQSDELVKEAAGKYQVCVLMDQEMLLQRLFPKILAIVAVAILVLGTSILCIAVYIRRLTGRVDVILNGMEEVETGNLQVRLDINRSGGDELDTIADHFNDMCAKLEEYIQKSYTAEIEKKNAQMQALQSQINPHFLYNTLEAIRMRAICNNDREVGKMLYSMSVLFRSQLKENDWITVGQELDYCKQYLELFECRFQGIFQYEIDCPVELLGTKVIKFILQPLVENYFIHGIRRQENDNLIRIQAKKQDGYLFFSILDNGLGMEMDAIEEKNRELQDCGLQEKEKTAIGLANVNRRIRAVYGENCGISLKKNSIQGLEIIVKVQMEKDEQ